MSKRQYDFIVGLGGACSCSQGLRAAGLQYLSFPFDWIAGLPFSQVAITLANGCKDLLSDESTLKRLPDAPGSNEAHWVDVRCGLLYLHDFYRETSLHDQMDGVRSKYRRRAKRFDDIVSASKRVLLVWVETPGVSPMATQEDILAGHAAMAQRYPSVCFDVLHIAPANGVPLEKATISEEGPIRTVTYDYWDKKLGGMEKGDEHEIARFLASEYAVRDYRTPQERRNESRVRRQRYYRRLNAKTYLEYLITSWQYRIYKHFWKILTRKGVV